MDVGVNAQPGNKDKDKNAPPSHHPRFWTINGNKTGGSDFLGTTNNMPINFKTAGWLRMLISPLGDVNMFGNLLVNKKITGQAMQLTGLSGDKGMLAVDENGDLFRKDFEADTFVFYNMQIENLKVGNNFQIGNTIYANVDPAADENYIYTSDGDALHLQENPSYNTTTGGLNVFSDNDPGTMNINGNINFTGELLKDGKKAEFSPWGEEMIHYTNGYYGPDTVFNKVITTPLPQSYNGIDKFYFYSIGINTLQPNARLELVGKDYMRYEVDYSCDIRFRDIFVDETDANDHHYVWDIVNDRGILKFNYGYGFNDNKPSTSNIFNINQNGVINEGKRTEIGGSTYINGKTCIGTNNFDANDGLLNVNGNITAEDIKVTDVVTADYIFEKDYKLLNIDSLALFIKQNEHLPNIPSADEMKQNGITLAKMNGLLLQKIEELTLYMIELKKENEKLKEQGKKIDVVMWEIEKLKEKIK